jgi:hypothetical protein
VSLTGWGRIRGEVSCRLGAGRLVGCFIDLGFGNVNWSSLFAILGLRILRIGTCFDEVDDVGGASEYARDRMI